MTNNDDNDDRGFKKAAKLIGIGGVVALLISLVVFSWFAAMRQWRVGDPTDWGTFGDFVGGVAGTIIALLTLIAVVLTLSLQEAELRQTRRLVGLQTNAMSRQQFEATFFKLLDQFTSASEALRSCDLPKQFDQNMQDAFARVVLEDGDDHLTWRSDDYRRQYEHFEPFLGPYFRSFFHVIKFVDQSALTEQEKAYYTSLARAQIAAKEAFLQFANAVFHEEGRTGLKPNIEKYGLLKHVNSVKFPQYARRFRDTHMSRTAFMSRAERESYWTSHPAEKPDDRLVT